MMKGDKDKRKSWSVKTEKDGICTSIEVREVSNGFIICKTKYGDQEEWISKENPLADGEKEEEKEEKEEKGPLGSLKGIFNSLGGGDAMY